MESLLDVCFAKEVKSEENQRGRWRKVNMETRTHSYLHLHARAMIGDLFSRESWDLGQDDGTYHTSRFRATCATLDFTNESGIGGSRVLCREIFNKSSIIRLPLAWLSIRAAPAMSEGQVQRPGALMVVAEPHKIGKSENQLDQDTLLTAEPRYIPCPGH